MTEAGGIRARKPFSQPLLGVAGCPRACHGDGHCGKPTAKPRQFYIHIKIYIYIKKQRRSEQQGCWDGSLQWRQRWLPALPTALCRPAAEPAGMGARGCARSIPPAQEPAAARGQRVLGRVVVAPWPDLGAGGKGVCERCSLAGGWLVGASTARGAGGGRCGAQHRLQPCASPRFKAARRGAGWGSFHGGDLQCGPLPSTRASVSPGEQWGGRMGMEPCPAPGAASAGGAPSFQGGQGSSRVLLSSVLPSPALESWPGLWRWAVMSALGQGKRGRRLLPGKSPAGPHTRVDGRTDRCYERTTAAQDADPSPREMCCHSLP